MKTRYKILWPVVVLVTMLLLAVVVWAQTGGGYDLTWWTTDGGGGTVSGGGYTLMGTAGQPDAGMVGGGGYTLYGGFWPGGGGGGTACIALTNVTVSGPSSGNTGETLTFTAAVTPTNATTPITYTWSGDGLVGANGNQATYRWDIAGQHQVAVSAANCGGSANDSHSVTISGGVHIYLPLVVRNMGRP